MYMHMKMYTCIHSMIYVYIHIAACNRTYTALNGRITSPGWPGTYRSRENCRVSVQVPATRSLVFYFGSFRLEAHSNCQYDYLKVSTSLCGTTTSN